jgi:hypothetical protein
MDQLPVVIKRSHLPIDPNEGVYYFDTVESRWKPANRRTHSKRKTMLKNAMYESFYEGRAKFWTGQMDVEQEALDQIRNISRLPILDGHMAVMPDVHYGLGATVGSVIPLNGAVIPAAVGVDIGCGMEAVQTTLKASDLPDSLHALRHQIERDVPTGFNCHNRDIPLHTKGLDGFRPSLILASAQAHACQFRLCES